MQNNNSSLKITKRSIPGRLSTEKDMFNSKKQSIISLLFILLFVNIVLVLVYLNIKLQKQLDEMELKASLPKTYYPSLIPTSSPFVNLENQKELVGIEVENYLSDVFLGKTVFDQKDDNVLYAIREFNFSSNPQEDLLSFVVTSYYYQPGNSKFSQGYEGLTWDRDLDIEINNFQNLQPGSQIASVYDVVGQQKAIVNSKKFGNREYAIYDTYFKPGGNWDRHYVTYDRNNRQLIFITFSFTNYSIPNRFKVNSSYNKTENYFDKVEYPTEIVDYLDRIDNILSKF